MNKAKRTTMKFKPAFSIAYAIVGLVVAGIAIAGLTPVLTRKLPNLSTSSIVKNPKGWYEAYNAPKNGNGDPSDNHKYKPEDLEPWQRYCKTSTNCDTPVKCSTLPGGECKFTPPKGITKFELFAIGGGGAAGSAVAQNPSSISFDYARSVLGKDQSSVSGNTVGYATTSTISAGAGYDIVGGTFIDDNEGTSASGLPARSNVIDVAASKISTYPTTSTDSTTHHVTGTLGKQSVEQKNVQYQNPFLDIFKANKFEDNKFYYYYTKSLGATKIGQPSVITLMPEWVKLVDQDKYKARYFCISKLDPDCKNNPNFYSGSSYKRITTDHVLKDIAGRPGRKNLKAWATGCSEGGTGGDSLERTVKANTATTINMIDYKCEDIKSFPYTINNATSTAVIDFDWAGGYQAAAEECKAKGGKTGTVISGCQAGYDDRNNPELISECDAKFDKYKKADYGNLDCTLSKKSWGRDVKIRCGTGKTITTITPTYVENGRVINGVYVEQRCEDAGNLYLVEDYKQSAKGGTAGDGACATIGVNVVCVDGNGLCTRTNIYPTKFSAYSGANSLHKSGGKLITGKGEQKCKLEREDYLHSSNGRNTFWSSNSCNGSDGKGCGYVKKGNQLVCNSAQGKYCYFCMQMSSTDITDHGCNGATGRSASFQLGCNENCKNLTCGGYNISGGGGGYSAHLVNDGGCEKCGKPYNGQDGKNGERAFYGKFDYSSNKIENTPGTYNHLYTWYMPYVVKHLMFGTAGKMGEEVHTTLTLSEGEELSVIPGKQAQKTDYKSGKGGAIGENTVIKGGRYTIYAKGGAGGIGSQKTDSYLLCHISDLQNVDEKLPCYYNPAKFDAKDTQTVEATHPSENSFANKVKMSTTLLASNPGGGAFGYGTKSYSDFVCKERYLTSNDYWTAGNKDFFLEKDGYNAAAKDKCTGNAKIKYILPDDKKYSSGTGAVIIMW